MSMSTGSRETLATALAAGSSGSWVSCAKFCGRAGHASVRAYGTWGGTTITLQTASDSSGTGAATLENYSLTADGSKVVEVSYMDFIRVVSTGGAAASINVLASPHDRL